MARLQANKKNYKKAFDIHFNAYKNWTGGSHNSKRLVMCYCVECGLKCLIMKDNKIHEFSQANPEIAEALSSHDLKLLLKKVNGLNGYKFKEFQTEFGQTVTAENYHQLCRYCIHIKGNNMKPVEEFDRTLNEVAEWLKGVI